MKRNYIVSEESAEEQLDIFYSFYDFEPEDLKDEDTGKALKEIESKILKNIRQGYLEISESDNSIDVVQTLRKKDKDSNPIFIKYAELKGRHKSSMGKKSSNDNHGKMYALLGSLSGIGEKGILKMSGADLGLAECIAAFYQNI